MGRPTSAVQSAVRESVKERGLIEGGMLGGFGLRSRDA